MRPRQIILILALLPFSVSGGIYQWIDDQGNVNFGSVPPKQQKEYKVGSFGLNKQQNGGKQKPVTTAQEQQEQQQEPDKEKQDKPEDVQASDPKVSTKSLSPSPRKSAKKYNKEKLDALVQRLRQGAVKPIRKEPSSTASVIQAKPEKAKIPEKVEQPERVVKRDKSEAKLVVPVQSSVADNSKKDKEPDVPNKEKNKQENETAVAKAPEKCGLFTGFVEEYQYKVKEECPGKACSIFKRQLEKYKVKMKRYC